MPVKQQATTNHAGVVVSVGYRSGQCLLGASSKWGLVTLSLTDLGHPPRLLP